MSMNESYLEDLKELCLLLEQNTLEHWWDRHRIYIYLCACACFQFQGKLEFFHVFVSLFLSFSLSVTHIASHLVLRIWITGSEWHEHLFSFKGNISSLYKKNCVLSSYLPWQYYSQFQNLMTISQEHFYTMTKNIPFKKLFITYNWLMK